ncbi:MAG: hypothetical protein IKE62_01755 [Oscillospiraceae bacterium]|nr:hypothetical protein [Oscillospiraceae bacterium]
MSGLAFYIIIVFIAAAVTILVGVLAYNKRLDKIARGEARDTHSAIPEPRTTVGVAYRTVLMVLVVIMQLTVSSLSGKISSMQNTINDLTSRQNSLNFDLQNMVNNLEEQQKLVQSCSVDVVSADNGNRTAVVRCSVSLKRYSEGTGAVLVLGDREVVLTREAGGVFAAEFTVGWFEQFNEPKLVVTEDGVSVAEDLDDMPQFILWDIVPMPYMSSSFTSGKRFGKLTYEGSFAIGTDRPQDVESVSLSYLTGGRVLKTMDVTQETMDGTTITLEQGLKLESDLTLRVELVSKTGLVIIDQYTVIYDSASFFGDMNYTTITDLDGTVLWDERSVKNYW